MTEVSPTKMSKWLGLAYAGTVIVFLLWNADAPDVILLSILFLPWIVGPAALAAIGAKVSDSTDGAWTFFAVQALIVGSTAWVWTYLIVIAPDAQNGIAMMFFPVLQYAVVLGCLGIAATFRWLARRDKALHEQES